MYPKHVKNNIKKFTNYCFWFIIELERVMTKNLKLTFILLFIFSAILIAFKTLTNFFSGVAINFIGLVGLLFVVLLLIMNDKSLFNRIKDLFIIAGVFCLLELLVYFVFEYDLGNYKTLKGFSGFQNVLSIFGLLFFAYIAFRFVCEMKGRKFKFIEIILGNEKLSVKAKKQKELNNGSLEDKPNRKYTE